MNPPATGVVGPDSWIHRSRTRRGQHAHGIRPGDRGDPAAAATHRLTVALVAPRAADVELRLETLPSTRLPVLGSTSDARWCRPGHGRIHCEVRVGVPAQGVWTAVVAKRSSPPPAAIEITLGSTPG